MDLYCDKCTYILLNFEYFLVNIFYYLSIVFYSNMKLRGLRPHSGGPLNMGIKLLNTTARS